jgi:hypothetical protein
VEKHFSGTVTKSGSKAIIQLPFDPNETWGEKHRHHITGTVNEVDVRGALVSIDDQYCLSPGPAWLRKNSIAAGDAVEVTLSPEGPQLDDLDDDIRQALESEPQAQAFFVSLATFYRTGYLRWINVRNPEVRASRVVEMVSLLKAGKKQR